MTGVFLCVVEGIHKEQKLRWHLTQATGFSRNLNLFMQPAHLSAMLVLAWGSVSESSDLAFSQTIYAE